MKRNNLALSSLGWLMTTLLTAVCSTSRLIATKVENKKEDRHKSEREREAHTNSNQENRMRQPAWSQHDPGTDLSCQNRKELVLRLPSMYGTALGNLHYCYAMHSRTQSHLSFFQLCAIPSSSADKFLPFVRQSLNSPTYTKQIKETKKEKIQTKIGDIFFYKMGVLKRVEEDQEASRFYVTTTPFPSSVCCVCVCVCVRVLWVQCPRSRFRFGAGSATRDEIVFQFAKSRLNNQMTIFELVWTALS